MDTAMDVDLIPPNKICRTCRVNVIPTYLVYKNCRDCREKNRLKTARRVERKREQTKHIEDHKNMLMESVSADDDDGRRFPTSENAISSGSKSSTSSSAGAAKMERQQPKLLHELEGKEKKYATREMKASLQKKIKDKGGKKLLVGQFKNHVEGNVTEFQTASLLYEKLKRKTLRSSAVGKHLRFHGCHSIVAVSTIDHEDRATMVTNDLRKIARISFARSCSKIETMSDDSWCSMLYDCRCLSAAGAGLSKQDKAQKGVVECNGIVRVTAELDDSHPRGLEGQKITVHIHH